IKIRIDQADRYFSIWIRLRDMKCKRCMSPVQLNDKGLPITHQCSHFCGRAKEATRFEPLNADALCPPCHLYFTANPAIHYAWQVEKKGQKVVGQLVLASNAYVKKERKLEAAYWKERIWLDYGVKA
ncbi:MAG: hypothetical protein KGL39_26980, partial [Patescibacteria group bacterium]|nr:hypothetical protein [Patescibacteria group bacterium]